MNIIWLSDALREIMFSKNPFSICYVTCDVGRKKGGDLIQLENVMLSFHQDKLEDLGFELPSAPVTEFQKKPEHYGNATRNVILPNGMIRKFHIRLLLTYNGKKVYY
jgi:hypothetical protein